MLVYNRKTSSCSPQRHYLTVPLFPYQLDSYKRLHPKVPEYPFTLNGLVIDFFNGWLSLKLDSSIYWIKNLMFSKTSCKTFRVFLCSDAVYSLISGPNLPFFYLRYSLFWCQFQFPSIFHTVLYVLCIANLKFTVQVSNIPDFLLFVPK